jgi:hypothetical protein
MIISVSSRSDIPAFYADWFMNRIRAGYCTVPNPFNPNQIAQVSLKPEDVEVIVFWTRNPAPLLPYLPEMARRGYSYYFLFTLMDNPRGLEVNLRTLEANDSPTSDRPWPKTPYSIHKHLVTLSKIS